MALPVHSDDIEKRLDGLAKTAGLVDPKDILDVVESVMVSIRDDHTSLNHHLYAEIEALAKYIDTAKAEISAIKADKINKEYLPEASDQLSAIVGATEQATNDIFEAAEAIEALAAKMEPETAERVTDAVTRVYGACSFQDITGQRISKVVKALRGVEAKVHALLQALGEDSGTEGHEIAAETVLEVPARADKDLMNGPQTPDDAIGQDDVDALLANFD